MTAGLAPLMLLAALGFLLSVGAHVASIIGVTLPGGQWIWFLHVGIFVVWFPTVLIANRVGGGERGKDLWKIVLSGCPRWMRLAGYVLFAYVILNFVYFMSVSSGHRNSGGAATAVEIRGFSGHWMIFYGAAFMTLYSVLKRPQLLGKRTCSNGHLVSASNKFCPTCGEALRDEAPPRRCHRRRGCR